MYTRGWGLVAAALALPAAVALLSSIGGPHDPLVGLVVVVERLARAGVGPALYLASAFGWGLALRPWLAGARRPVPIAAALGLALMVTMTQVLGASGALGTAWGAWAPVGAGIGLLAWKSRAWWPGGGSAPGRTDRPEAGPTATHRPEAGPTALLLACAGVGVSVMLVAACSPPGWLWGSEFGGYDALSYHLQLPKEWMAGGRVWPVEHNVYSYLPGYAEAAFVHVARLTGGLAGSAQVLHAGLALVAAWLTGEAVRGAGGSRVGAVAAGAILLCVPWVVVTGSMAYNEMGVLAMLAGAMAAAWEQALPPLRRGLIVGALIGAACGFKPTAIVLAAPAAGVALLGATERRQWGALLAGAAASGLIMLAPWLIRNGIACGNPVFPYLSGVFGPSHWSPEQFARFAAGHRFDGSVLDRLTLLVWPDRADPARPGVAVHRGMLHAQYSIFFPLALAAIGAAIAARATRRAGLVLAAGLAAQVLGWLAFMHLQSRFLLPLCVTGAIAAGVVSGARGAWAMVAAAVVLAGSTVWGFSRERAGAPNATLAGGTALFDGALLREEWDRASPAHRIELAGLMSPEAFVNLALPDGRLYLLGDATPFYYRVPVLYHTTWDASPLGGLIRAHPGRPEEWGGALRAMGVTHVLWSPSEVSRLHRSGWYDPIVNNEAIEEWLRGHADPVQAWPESGRYLFRLRPAP